MASVRKRVYVDGVVQGVGFRPFVFHQANRSGLTGWVANTPAGVSIEIQGDEKQVTFFIEALTRDYPPLARPMIADIETRPAVPDETVFLIELSTSSGAKRAAIASDAATCPACLRELLDSNDRRYRYPFINCTHCGPRYTIITDIPYDRVNTTMKKFVMCPACQAEYDDPGNRRFHAQPNACPVCGPRLHITDCQGRELSGVDPIEHAIANLENGSIVAVKGLGGFHLAVRADSDQAVQALRQRKYRKAKALALMVKDLAHARALACVDQSVEQIMQTPQCPIVLCRKRQEQVISRLVAPRSRYWGLMLPYTPIHHLLMRGEYPALVMTSGNMTDEPIEHDNACAIERLQGIADFFLLHDRAIDTSCDDSIVKVFQGKPLMIRRARGYVPSPIPFKGSNEAVVLALGAQLKNTISVVKSSQAFVSQHIGDLDNYTTYQSFRRTAEKLTALVDARPEVIACDLHPDLLSTRYAETFIGRPLLRIQHHHAHIAAVLGEHDLHGPVIGLALDGLGWGDDQTIWGCELLIANRAEYRRLGSLRAVALPGGDAANKQPWRMALSYLYDALGQEQTLLLTEKWFSKLDLLKRHAVLDMLVKNIQCPLGSSLGRLFDAVSALLGICLENTYEAQAAIELEYLCQDDAAGDYPICIVPHEGRLLWDARPIIQAIVRDRLDGLEPGAIAMRFHHSVILALLQWTRMASEQTGLKKVALAGGVFQNDYILTKLTEALQNNGFSVYYNEKLPVNDAAVSFGQAVVACEKISKSAYRKP